MIHYNNITCLKNNEIDKVKWDSCIHNANNGLIYGYSFYLDIMTKHWDGLILNDYEAVMPLTWNRKFGIYYLYQPFFTASLGVFGNIVSADIVNIFLDNIPGKYKYWDIYLNHANLFKIKGYALSKRSNYVLDLNKSYTDIVSSYAENHRRNIKKAEKFGCIVEKNIPIKKIIQLAKEQSLANSNVNNEDYNNFQKLFGKLNRQKQAETYGIYNNENTLLSGCVYFFSNNWAYYIFAVNHPDSKKSGASHFLINSFIKENAGKKLFLDFEGSNIKGVADFYSKFGAKEEKYPALKLNRLPAVLKMFKK